MIHFILNTELSNFSTKNVELDFVNKIVGIMNVDLLLPTFTLFEG